MARRAIFVACFLAALAAGFAAGVAFSSWRGAERGSFMGRELDLSPEQAEKMHGIWDEAMKKRRLMHREQADAVKAERIEAVKSLLDESEVAEYEAILAAEQAARDAARARSTEIFDRASEETMQILNAEQQEQYMEFVTQRRDRHRRNGKREDAPGAAPSTPQESED